MALLCLLCLYGCKGGGSDRAAEPKITLVNSPTDIVTLGAQYIAAQVSEYSHGAMNPKVFHSGVLSGGKGKAEIEMCQQGSIEMHVTSTAYLANLVPKMSIVSLPFLFRDIRQVIGLVQGGSPTLDSINRELNTKNLHIIAWWPRGFRQLTNGKWPIRTFKDLQGLKFRVMNNPMYVDDMNAMGAEPVPMEWGEVYNALQLGTIDGQENAEDVIYSSRLYETQKYMTVWDYSTDLEVVLANLDWWNALTPEQQAWVGDAARASVAYEIDLLKKNTEDLRRRIVEEGMQITYMPVPDRRPFRDAVQPVWDKYEHIFGKSFVDQFLAELEKY